MSLFTNALFVLTLASAGLTAVPAVAQLSTPSIRVVDEMAQSPQGKGGCCKKKECKECSKECREKCGKKSCKSCKKC